MSQIYKENRPEPAPELKNGIKHTFEADSTPPIYRSERTEFAFQVHKYLMFCGFWLCIFMAVADIVNNPETAIEAPGAAIKIKHQAAFINDKKPMPIAGKRGH